MEIIAKATNIEVVPRKLRLLTHGLRGLTPQKAIQKLIFFPQKGSEFLVKVIKQASANATNNFKLAEDSLYIKTVEINEGFKIKRMDASHGARYDRGMIKKRRCHIILTLEDKKPENKSRIKKQLSEEITKKEVIKKGKTKIENK